MQCSFQPINDDGPHVQYWWHKCCWVGNSSQRCIHLFTCTIHYLLRLSLEGIRSIVWLHWWNRSVVVLNIMNLLNSLLYPNSFVKHDASDILCGLYLFSLKYSHDEIEEQDFLPLTSLKIYSPGVSFECFGKYFWQESFSCFSSGILQSLV